MAHSGESLQSDRSLRERYSSELVDDLHVDGADASSDRDEEDLHDNDNPSPPRIYCTSTLCV